MKSLYPTYGAVNMSVREFYAALAMNGLLSDTEDMADECYPGESCPDATARLAVEHADALIKALKK